MTAKNQDDNRTPPLQSQRFDTSKEAQILIPILIGVLALGLLVVLVLVLLASFNLI